MTVTDSTKEGERERGTSQIIHSIDVTAVDWRHKAEFYLSCTITLPVLHSISAKESQLYECTV